MDIFTDTASYEEWLAGFAQLDADDIALKHARMNDRSDPFPFFRGTYYRWVRHWLAACLELNSAPRVLGVGDLHIANFGSWRDVEGRLCWGVNDFDEADEIPYTLDLVRLAASVRFAKKSGVIRVKFRAACAAILAGYRESLDAGGQLFVLEERHHHLRTIAMGADRDPVQFWAKIAGLLSHPAVEPPEAARVALLQQMPHSNLMPSFRFHHGVGMGSLGKPRFLALAEWSGSWICRETKLITPSATAWMSGSKTSSRIGEIVARAVRPADPFYYPKENWLVRRLAPRCTRIELAHLRGSDLLCVLHSKGAETANIHLGTPQAGTEVLRDLDARSADWLPEAAKSMSKLLEIDWKNWCNSKRSNSGRGNAK